MSLQAEEAHHLTQQSRVRVVAEAEESPGVFAEWETYNLPLDTQSSPETVEVALDGRPPVTGSRQKLQVLENPDCDTDLCNMFCCQCGLQMHVCGDQRPNKLSGDIFALPNLCISAITRMDIWRDAVKQSPVYKILGASYTVQATGSCGMRQRCVASSKLRIEV